MSDKLGITLLNAKWLDPECHQGCQSLVLKHRIDELTHIRKLEGEASKPPDALIFAFVQGAQWWEYHKTGATMWPSDRDQAEGEAEKRAESGTLGKSPEQRLAVINQPNQTST